MDKEDTYLYFLIEAILNTNPNVLYLYSKKDNILFRIKNLNNVWTPAFYNEHIKTEIYSRRTSEVYKLIDELMQKSSFISELEKIDEPQKKTFINQYIDSVHNKADKEELRNQLSHSNLRGNERIVGKILGDTFLGIVYSHELWLFLEKTFKSSYYPLGITLESQVYL